jgi:exopolysaccharide production protein ExoQ
MAMSTTTMPVMTATPAVREVENGDPLLFRRGRTWWMLLTLFMLAQGNGLFTRQDDSYYRVKTLKDLYEPGGNLLLLTIATTALCIAMMIGYLIPTLRLMLRHKSILIFALLPLISVAWSQDPTISLRKATILLLSVVFAWFFATYYTPADQMRVLMAAGVIVGVASIAMALALPQFGIASSGEWKGVFAQKNRLGLSMFFLFSGLPFQAFCGRREWMKLALQSLFPIGLILLSHSKTSLILTFLLVLVRIFGPFAARCRRENLPFLLFAIAGSIAGAGLMIAFGLNAILSLLGRDITLTGRTEHWGLLASFAARHLWLGYGYQAFWEGSTGDSGRFIALAGTGMRGADSGYLDAALQLGLLGIAVLFVLLLVSLRDFLKLFRRPTLPLMALWYAGVIVVTYIGDFTEGLFWVSSGVYVFVFVIAIAGLKYLRSAAVYQASLPTS